MVALFDSWAPGYREDMSPRDQRLRQRRINFHARLEKVGRVRRGELGLKEITWKPLLRRLRDPVRGGGGIVQLFRQA